MSDTNWRTPEAVTLAEVNQNSHYLVAYKSLHPFEDIKPIRLVRSIDSNRQFTDELIYDLNTQEPWTPSAYAWVRPIDSMLEARPWATPLGKGVKEYPREPFERMEINCLREVVKYAQTRRGNQFDYDTWIAMADAAMSGKQEPSAFENEITAHACTLRALATVRKERDELRKKLAELEPKPATEEEMFYISAQFGGDYEEGSG